MLFNVTDRQKKMIKVGGLLNLVKIDVNSILKVVFLAD